MANFMESAIEYLEASESVLDIIFDEEAKRATHLPAD
jgi:hypothetical protein